MILILKQLNRKKYYRYRFKVKIIVKSVLLKTRDERFYYFFPYGLFINILSIRNFYDIKLLKVCKIIIIFRK